MAMSPHSSSTPTGAGGGGPVRRIARALRGHRPSEPHLDERLHTLLPLRYAFDAFDPGTDPLTGLGSQPAFLASLGQRAARLERDAVPYSLVLMDLDLLGLVNVRHGYVEGDTLLRSMAAALKHGMRVEDHLFRIGGDEFAALMPGAGPDEAVSLVAGVLETMEHPAGDELPGTFSAGIASAPGTAREADILYRQAAAALADVKRAGRNGVALFDPARHRVPDPTPGPGSEVVDTILAERALRPVFQPIVDLRNGRVLGFEGLVRSDTSMPGHGTRELFAAAQDSGRVVELELACIETVVAGARAIRSDQLLTLNLSPRTLAGRDFEPAWLLRSLVQGGISPGRVIVELSDGEPVEDLARLQRSFHELQRAGLRMAADDVSVDDPARRLLTHVPFDIVKIDLGQVWESAQSGPRLALLRDAALSRHARVVAERVETSEQLVALRDLEFGAGQGFLLGRPDASLDVSVVDVQRLQVDVPEVESVTDVPLLVGAPIGDGPVDDEDELEIPPERRAIFLPPAVRPMLEAGSGPA